MFRFALGMIETIGLVAAIEAADTGVKSANVKLLGYELTKGNGLITVKFAGDVGAVKVAVEAGSIAAAKINKIWSKHVIPRPHDEIEKLIKNLDTVGNSEETKAVKESENKDMQIESSETEKVEEESNFKMKEKIKEDNSEKGEEMKVDNMKEIDKEEQEKDTVIKKQEGICNICGDSRCPRRKGEPKSLCIHYKK